MEDKPNEKKPIPVERPNLEKTKPPAFSPARDERNNNDVSRVKGDIKKK